MEGVEKREPSYTVGGKYIGAATTEKSMEGSQKKKNKTELPYDLAIPFPAYTQTKP